MTDCPYSDTLPEESTCRERRQQRRLLPHRNLWAGCSCGRVLGERPKEEKTVRPGEPGSQTLEAAVSEGSKQRPTERQGRSTRVRAEKRPMDAVTVKSPGRAHGKAAPRSGKMYAAFSGGPAPKNAPGATNAPRRPMARPGLGNLSTISPAKEIYNKRHKPCPNCGKSILVTHRGCTPCEKAKGNPERLAEIRAMRAAGTIKRGRPVMEVAA